MLQNLETRGKRVRFARGQLGLSQAQFAEKLGLKQPSIAAIEAGGAISNRVREGMMRLRINMRFVDDNEGPVLLQHEGLMSKRFEDYMKLKEMDSVQVSDAAGFTPKQAESFFSAITVGGDFKPDVLAKLMDRFRDLNERYLKYGEDPMTLERTEVKTVPLEQAPASSFALTMMAQIEAANREIAFLYQQITSLKEIISEKDKVIADQQKQNAMLHALLNKTSDS